LRLALVVALMTSGVGFAQDVTEPALKAAFIYNFVRFTEWPSVPSGTDPFTMCVVGDAAVSDALERTVKGRDIEGRPMAVSRTARPVTKQPCHVLYVSGTMRDQSAQLVAAVRDAPVLTISDIDGFGNVGGIVQFFFEHGQLRFSIKRESATRAGLRISSRLLVLSK
jgi:hypothetical protein